MALGGGQDHALFPAEVLPHEGRVARHGALELGEVARAARDAGGQRGELGDELAVARVLALELVQLGIDLGRARAQLAEEIVVLFRMMERDRERLEVTERWPASAPGRARVPARRALAMRCIHACRTAASDRCSSRMMPIALRRQRGVRGRGNEDRDPGVHEDLQGLRAEHHAELAAPPVRGHEDQVAAGVARRRDDRAGTACR